jgi:primosomal protein N' (replication factor Y)
MYIEVIIPLAIRGTLTYKVPEVWVDQIQFGIRVEIPFGKKKRYAALVIQTDVQPPTDIKIRSILQPIDRLPLISGPQLKLWRWISQYYACTMGEVMQAALPAALKLESQTKVKWVPNAQPDHVELSDDEYLLTEALQIQKELSIQDIQDILEKKTVYPVIQSLMNKGFLQLSEEVQKRYKEKKEKILRLKDPFSPNAEELREAFDLTERSEYQTNLLLLLIQESRDREWVPWPFLRKKAKVNYSVAKALKKKGIIEIDKRKKSRLPDYGETITENDSLSEEQTRVHRELMKFQENKKTSLVFGVTGSGKTQIYFEFIQKCMDQDQQVLYMVPEIGLTAQLTDRLKKICGNELVVYHSKLNNHERVEAWKAVLNGKKVVLAPRSGLLLPFQNLGLIIVDEEHDRSLKQFDPAPRYHARDTAIKYAHQEDFNVILGSATPAFESLHNAEIGNYGFTRLEERYGGVELPEIELLDMTKYRAQNKVRGSFSHAFIEAMEHCLSEGEQILLFHNRRGYVPVVHCTTCGWHAMCRHCDISLTYHKYEHKLKCHYCGYFEKVPPKCPDCSNPSLIEKGMGTQKIEEELKDLFEERRIKRLDWDTARGKYNFQKIIEQFDREEIDILVGTQMITKGLDFDNVGMVGVVDADQLLFFPGYRTNEYAFQMLIQVSGRSGRRQKRGKVFIQTSVPKHPVLQKVKSHEYWNFYKKEIAERHQFRYPPFKRLIHLEIKHKNADKALAGALALYHFYQNKLEGQLQEPAQAPIPRISNTYIYQLQCKIDNSSSQLAAAKKLIREGIDRLKKSSGYSTVRVNVDVDPM